MCEKLVLVASAIGKLQHFKAFLHTFLYAIRLVFIDSVTIQNYTM